VVIIHKSRGADPERIGCPTGELVAGKMIADDPLPSCAIHPDQRYISHCCHNFKCFASGSRKWGGCIVF